MPKFKIARLGSFLVAVLLACSLTVSCSLLAPNEAATTKDILGTARENFNLGVVRRCTDQFGDRVRL